MSLQLHCDVCNRSFEVVSGGSYILPELCLIEYMGKRDTNPFEVHGSSMHVCHLCLRERQDMLGRTLAKRMIDFIEKMSGKEAK